MFKRITNKLIQTINKATLCPMALRPLVRSPSPETLQAVVDAGCLKQSVTPVEPDLSLIENVLVLAPHQDDESIGCGGLMAKLAGAARITVVFITDGAAGNLGVSADDSVPLRRTEALNALKHCNAEARFLDIPNAGIKFDQQCIDLIKAELETESPDLLLAPWMFDRPVKHRICAAALCEALRQLPRLRNTPLWGYQVHNCLFPNVVVDITDHADTKAQMIRCHQSQLNSVAAFDHYILGMNQWNAQYLSSNRRGFAELFCALPVHEWLAMYDSIIRPRVDAYIADS